MDQHLITVQAIEKTKLFILSKSTLLQMVLKNTQFQDWFGWFVEFATDQFYLFIHSNHAKYLQTPAQTDLIPVIESLLLQIRIEIKRLLSPIICFAQKSEIDKYCQTFDDSIFMTIHPYFVNDLSPILIKCLQDRISNIESYNHEEQLTQLSDISLYGLSDIIEIPYIESLNLLINKQIGEKFQNYEYNASHLNYHLEFLSVYIFPTLMWIKDEYRLTSIKHRLEFQVYRTYLNHLYMLI
jgi:hypothetical protein